MTALLAESLVVLAVLVVLYEQILAQLIHEP